MNLAMVYCRTLPQYINLSKRTLLSNNVCAIMIRNVNTTSVENNNLRSHDPSHLLGNGSTPQQHFDLNKSTGCHDLLSNMCPYSPNINSLSSSKQSTYLKPVSSSQKVGDGSFNLMCTRSVHTSHPARDIYIIHNEEEFEDKVMRSALPVVINFHADWCEPCHALKPLLENLAKKFNGRMHLAEVKIDDHVALLQTFEVTAVPAVVGVVKGQVTEKFVGLISEPEVRAFVKTMIGE